MVIKVFRFLNLLEPERNIISISKVFMWLMIAATVKIVILAPEDMAAVLGTLSATLMAVGNYGYRRYEQRKEKERVSDKS